MSASPRNLLVVNSGKEAPIPILMSMSELRPFVVTEHRYRHMWPADTHIACVDNASDPYQVHKAALALLPDNGFIGAAGLSERTIGPAGYVASQLALPHGYRMETAARSTSKFAMKQALAKAGVRTAGHRLVPTPNALFAHDWSFPTIFKPTIGGGVSGVFVVHTSDELHSSRVVKQITKLGKPQTPSSDRFPLIAEDFLPVDREFHVDALVLGGQVRRIAVSEYFRPVMAYAGGGMFGSRTLRDPALRAELIDLHKAVVHACGMTTGITHFEALMSGGELFAGEIAARPGGGGIPLMLRHALGWDTWATYLQLAAGIECEAECGSPSVAKDGYEDETQEFFAQCMFPLEPGVVEHVPSCEDLERVPGVREAIVSIRAGQLIAGARDSSTTSAVVVASASDSAQLDSVIDQVRRSFHMRMAKP